MENKKLIKTDEKWKKVLTSEQFDILRKKGTESAFIDGNWQSNKEKGKYYCVACDNLVFDSDDKFDSGTGWPSFSKPAGETAVEEKGVDLNQGVEIVCWKCEGHLGHVFSDGPKPEGKRYCINGRVLVFKPNNN